MSERARLHAWVTGRVQGVFFRESTRQEAERLGLTGWVRNLADGRVELVAEGTRPALEELLRWCHRGPPSARVDGVETEWLASAGDLLPFEVRRSALGP